MANIEAKYGLDKPVFEQYTTYLTNILQGDFGPSFKYQDYTVNELIAVALPVSAKVGFVAFIFTLLMGVTVGTIYTALKHNTRVDYTIACRPRCLGYNAIVCIGTRTDFSILTALEYSCWWLAWRYIHVHRATCYRDVSSIRSNFSLVLLVVTWSKLLTVTLSELHVQKV